MSQFAKSVQLLPGDRRKILEGSRGLPLEAQNQNSVSNYGAKERRMAKERNKRSGKLCLAYLPHLLLLYVCMCVCVCIGLINLT